MNSRHLHIQKCHIHRIFHCEIQGRLTIRKQVKLIDLWKPRNRQPKIVQSRSFIIHVNDTHLLISYPFFSRQNPPGRMTVAVVP